MDSRIRYALDALQKGTCTHKELRDALPLVLDLYHGIIEELCGPKTTVDDLCAVMQWASPSVRKIAAESLLTEPNIFIPESALVCILQYVSEHADDAAQQLIVDKTVSREALSEIVARSPTHAHEAGTRLLAMQPTETELGLIMTMVPTLSEQAGMLLGTFAGSLTEYPQA